MSKPVDRVYVFKDAKGDWRWTFISGKNHRKMATSGEGYRKKSSCLKGLERVTNAADVKVVYPT